MRRLPLLLLALLVLALPAQADARIKNGVPAGVNEFPWAVALVFADSTAESGEFCGGSLIAADRVMTAAHCAAGLAPDEVRIVAGQDVDNFLPGEEPGDPDPSDTDVYRTVDDIYLMSTVQGIDPDEQDEPLTDDVAILVLSDPVASGTPIATVEEGVADDDRWAVGDDLEVAGWGRDENDDYPEDLRKATIERRPDAECESAPVIGDFYLAAEMLCALGGDDTTVIDTCDGDSGGPLMTTETPGATKLVGLTSFGSLDCDDPDVPGVYTRIGAPDMHDFTEDVLSATPTTAPQIHAIAGADAPTLSGDAVAGETVTCTAQDDPGSDFTGAPDDFDLRLRIFDGFDLFTIAKDDTDPLPQPVEYTLGEGDVGSVVGCELYARKSGVGGYGVVIGDYVEVEEAATPTTPTTPTTPVTPPPSVPPVVIVTPPVVVPPPPDETRPATTLIRRRCVRRRCTFTVATVDRGGSVAGLRARLQSTFGCRRNGRRRICSRTITLTATQLGEGLFRLRSPKLRAGGRHFLRVRAVDAAGNLEARSRLLSFRLRRGGR